ncbi:MAG: ATP-binding cassette domain-containing protein, partial [Kiritimatiellia bacterium]|nr:ATP-binding cassette domain-containing protein [Kiritimatiellia bacterium]
MDGVSLCVEEREIVGLVGESGCGKSTFGRAWLQLEPLTSGEVRFRGRAISNPRGTVNRALRRRMQMVFQDPHASLTPHRTVCDLVSEP